MVCVQVIVVAVAHRDGSVGRPPRGQGQTAVLADSSFEAAPLTSSPHPRLRERPECLEILPEQVLPNVVVLVVEKLQKEAKDMEANRDRGQLGGQGDTGHAGVDVEHAEAHDQHDQVLHEDDGLHRQLADDGVGDQAGP